LASTSHSIGGLSQLNQSSGIMRQGAFMLPS